MRGRTPLAVAFLAVLWVISCPYPPAFAELAVGTVIDKTNAEQAQGLIPDPVLNWVKKGEGSWRATRASTTWTRKAGSSM